MNIREEWKWLVIVVIAIGAAFYLPIENQGFLDAIYEALWMVKDYAREHIILCLLPAFFIAGAVAVFLSKEWIGKYLGGQANKFVSYGVASVSGVILAVCSCTVLPLFAGIQKRGAGIGPATTFLYSGPAINVLAIVLSMRILGFELGMARMIGAIIFSIVIGLLMHLFFGKDDHKGEFHLAGSEDERPIWQNTIFIGSMVGILIFANLGDVGPNNAILSFLFSIKWLLVAIFSTIFFASLSLWFDIKWWKIIAAYIVVALSVIIFPGKYLLHFIVAFFALLLIAIGDDSEINEWFGESWIFAKQILPLLLAGVVVAGFLLGRPNAGAGIIPAEWVSNAVGGNSFWANLAASVAGAFMYFATLTEVPILEGLIGSGMGKGPALALLLAGPAVSLPNMLVIRSIIGTKKTLVFVALVISMATVSGMIYGALF
ncbi:MAG: permease [Candidatus Zixiibacteriota bacterium]